MCAGFTCTVISCEIAERTDAAAQRFLKPTELLLPLFLQVKLLLLRRARPYLLGPTPSKTQADIVTITE